MLSLIGEPNGTSQDTPDKFSIEAVTTGINATMLMCILEVACALVPTVQIRTTDSCCGD